MTRPSVVSSWPPRCGECGRFIGHSDGEARRYAPYARPDGTEPPDWEYICGRCWGLWDISSRAKLDEILWIKPECLWPVLESSI